MPYIEKKDRPQYDSLIEDIVDQLTDHGLKAFGVGELNYVISSIVTKIFKQHPSYSYGNNLVGVLECVKQEFYRRPLVEYEDGKLKTNGDI